MERGPLWGRMQYHRLLPTEVRVSARTRDRSRRGAGLGSCASPAELDALGAAIAATAAMADRARR